MQYAGGCQRGRRVLFPRLSSVTGSNSWEPDRSRVQQEKTCVVIVVIVCLKRLV